MQGRPAVPGQVCGMIKTKSIYAPSCQSDGTRVLITRHHPRGVSKDKYHEWLRDATPSKDLLAQYKAGLLTNDEFASKYKVEMESAIEVVASLRLMHKMGSTITLLCYEREGEFCHRHVLKEIIEGGPSRANGLNVAKGVSP